MNEPRRLGIGPTLGLIAILVGGLVLAATVPLTSLYYVSYVGVGALLAIRRPRNSIGWLLVAIGFGFICDDRPVIGRHRGRHVGDGEPRRSPRRSGSPVGRVSRGS